MAIYSVAKAGKLERSKLTSNRTQKAKVNQIALVVKYALSRARDTA